MSSPFTFVNAVTFTKENLFEDPQAEKEYVPFLVNRALSYHYDTVMYANEMNRYASTPKKWQFDFFLRSLTKRSRFSKWAKKDTVSESIVNIATWYGMSYAKAAQVVNLFTPEQLAELKLQLSKGGKRK